MTRSTSPARCSQCPALGVYRYAVTESPTESPDAALWRAPEIRCAAHFPIGFPSWVAAVARPGCRLVLDPEFTAAAVGTQCGCGLPGDHRFPASGEGRPCLPADATVRFLPTSLPAVPVIPGQLNIVHHGFTRGDRS